MILALEQGIPELLEAIEHKLDTENDISLDGSRIVVTAGSNMGFVNAVLAIAALAVAGSLCGRREARALISSGQENEKLVLRQSLIDLGAAEALREDWEEAVAARLSGD